MQLIADADPGGSLCQHQRLGVGVDGHELHTLDAFLDHPVDGIAAAAAHTNYLDAGECFGLNSFLRPCFCLL